MAAGLIAGGAALTTRVMVLASEARREELARMLAGATITDEARAAVAASASPSFTFR